VTEISLERILAELGLLYIENKLLSEQLAAQAAPVNGSQPLPVDTLVESGSD
jgi:hypothetical protein